MSYPRDLDDYSERELLTEVARRSAARCDGRCDYCGRPQGQEPPCRYPERHRRPPASDAGTGRPDEADDVGLAVWSALAAKHRTVANLHAITDAVRNILAGAPEPRETQGEREPAESASLTHIVNVDLPCALTEALSHEQDPAVIARFVRANNALPEISAIVARASGKPEQPESEGERIEGEAPYEDATDEELVLAYGRAVVSYQRQHDGAVDWPGSKAIDRLRATRADLLRALSEGPKRKLIAAGRRIAEEVERARAESLQHSGQEPAK